MPDSDLALNPQQHTQQHAQQMQLPGTSQNGTELAQPWRKFITLNDGKSIESSTGEVRLQLERDQHKAVGGPFCQSPR